ncbi:MAG: DUF2723 domain-containing protein [Candidatus Eremiobacteraeota bacterium]|nr:DUF2723 domain-containing protein [Candidatus Eremiobacteraeota bacterium]
MFPKRAIIWALGLFLVLFSLYAFFLCPTVAAGDSAELATAAYTLGVAHPPGYPLFTMLGKLFTFIPLHQVAWRVNLMSAFFQALASVAVFLTLIALTGNLPASLTGALALSFSRIYWHYAEVAEVFPLNNFFSALLILILVLFRKEVSTWPKKGKPPRGAPPKKSGESEGRSPYALFYGAAFLYGLSFTNHHTMVLMAPAVIYYIASIWRGAGLTARKLVIAVALFAVAFVPYAYLPLAARGRPVINWDDPVTLSGFMNLLLRKDYGTLSLLPKESKDYRPTPRIMQIPVYVKSLARDFAFAGFLLGCLGLWALRKERDLFIFLLCAFFFTGFFFVLVANMPLSSAILRGVLERFYMMSEVVFALFIGFGACHALARVNSRPGGAPWAAPVLVIITVVPLFALNRGEADFRKNLVTLHFGRDLLAGVKEGGVLFCKGDVADMATDYVQLVEGARGDVKVFHQEKMTYAWYCAQMKERHPEVIIPGERYEGVKVKNIDLIRENKDRFPLYFYGVKEQSYEKEYRELPSGLSITMAPREEPPAMDALIRENEALMERFQQNLKGPAYPEHSFERQVLQAYGCPYFHIAFLYEQAQDYAKAREFYEKAIQMAPLYEPPYKNLGLLCLNKQNDREKAKECFRQYLRLKPEDPEREAIMKVITE